MSPIYFHGKYNRYKEQMLRYKTLFFNTVTTISYAFSPMMKKSLHATRIKRCISGSDPLFHSVSQSPTSLCSHPLFGFHKHSASVDECQQVQFFYTWRNSMTHLCFIHIFLSNTILSDCPSAATATKFNRTWVTRLILYCHVTNIRFQHCEPK